MARMGRYFLPDQPLHVIQRGNDRQPIFFVAEDYAHYRQWLSDAAAHYGAIHAYVFMTQSRSLAAHADQSLEPAAHHAVSRPPLCPLYQLLALGNDRFKKQIAKAVERRVTKLPRGPQPQTTGDKRQLSLL